MEMNIIGIDEVGIGSVCGPIVVAAVVFPKGLVVEGVADSKTLRPHQRIDAIAIIHSSSLHWVVAQSSSVQIDEFGIHQCLRGCGVVCAQRCLELFPDATIIIDGTEKLPHPIPGSLQQAIPKADVTVPAVSAASIIAKVWRDQYMCGIAAAYPAYDLGQNKGYPTLVHLAQLKRYGPCPEHRRSYEPVKRVLKGWTRG